MVSTASLKNKKGFTIVELLIVIVVIGILATLVIVTFTGIQQKGRNSQRQTDINAINSHVEAFYAQHGFYPNLADLQDYGTWVKLYMKGLDQAALSDPKAPSGNIQGTADASHYGYEPTASTGTCAATKDAPDTDGNFTDNGCDGYTLTANMEGQTGANATYVKKSS